MDRCTGPFASRRDQESQSRLKNLATLMIVDHVNRGSVSNYESWLTGIHGVLQKQHGFVSVDVIRRQDQSDPEYVILVKFQDQASLSRWRSSPELAVWLSKLDGLVAKHPRFEEAIGLELWFDRSTTKHRMPAFWKRVALNIACVYPMILALGWALAPVIENWPSVVQTFAVVVMLSALLTWPVMPYMTRLLKPWLYK